jgi:hypothetical protein
MRLAAEAEGSAPPGRGCWPGRAAGIMPVAGQPCSLFNLVLPINAELLINAELPINDELLMNTELLVNAELSTTLNCISELYCLLMLS